MTHPKKNPKQIMVLVQTTCEKMIRLLTEENTCLEAKKMGKIEALTKEKDALSQEIATLLATIKAWAKTASDDEKQALRKETETVNNHLGQINQLAQTNTTLLEANHTATVTFLDVVRRVISKPKPKTYGKEGTLNADENTQSLMTKSV